MKFQLKSKLVIINSVIVLAILLFSSFFTLKIYQDSFNVVSDRVNIEINNSLQEQTVKAAEITNNIIFESLDSLLRDVKIISDSRILHNLLEYNVLAKGELEETKTGYIQRYRNIRPLIDYQLTAGKLKEKFYYSQNSSNHIDIYDSTGALLGETVGSHQEVLNDTEKIERMLKSYIGYVDIMDIVLSDDGMFLKVYQKISEGKGVVGLSMPLDIDFLHRIKNITNTEVVLFKGQECIEGTIFTFGETIDQYKMLPEQGIFSELERDKKIIITGSPKYPDKIVDLGTIDNKQKIKKFRFAFIPLPDYSGKVVGMIAIGISATNIDQSLQAFQVEREKTNNRIIKTFIIVSIIALCIAISLIYTYATHGITRPLKHIIGVFGTGAKGDYSARVQIRRNDELGELADYFNNFMNVIENSHTQLSVSEARFRALFQKTADARVIIEGEHITECNEAAVTMLHCANKEAVLSMHPENLSPRLQPDGESSRRAIIKMIRYARTNGSHRFLWNNIRSDGEVFPTDVELTIIPYKNRRLLHALLRDISQQKAVEQQLIQAQKMESIGTLAGGIAHDFNNILTAIFGYTELASMHINNREKLQDDLNEIRGAGERAKSLVKQILTFSRKSEQIKHPLQVSLVVKEVTKLLRSSLPATIEIRLQIMTHEQMVLADPTRIHQILMNLCTNAHHAMLETGGVLGVSLQKKTIAEDAQILDQKLAPGHYLELEISDTGTGMDSTTKEKIFEPYFTTKESGEGTGLGLAVVHGIIQDYQGSIQVYSEPGQGTTFRVYLPVIDSQDNVDDSEKPEAINGSGNGHILFVDDEEKILSIANEIFHSYGYQISTFSSPGDALSAFKNNPASYDILVTDMTMPGMTGLELTKEIVTLKPNFPVVLCTGYSALINKKSSLSVGIKAYVSKPVVMSELVTLIKNILNEGNVS